MAVIASTVANTVRDAKKKPSPFKPADFMPEWNPKPQTPEQQQGIFHMLASFFKRG